MITYILDLKEDADQNKIIAILKSKLPSVKSDKKNGYAESTSQEFKIIYFFEEDTIIIMPKRVLKSTVGPEELVSTLRKEGFVTSAKAMFSVTKNSDLFDEVLNKYGTSIEKLAKEESNSILISKDVDGIEYLIHLDGKDEKINILVEDSDNNKKYFDVLVSLMKAIENDI